MSVNPFERDGMWLKAQLHAHSTESDGHLPPHHLAYAYDQAGFDVLSITDHWRLTDVPGPRELIMLPGAELTADVAGPMTADVLVYGLTSIPDDPGGDRSNWMFNAEENWEQRTFASIAAAADWAAGQGAVAVLAHPYWTGLPESAIDQVGRITAVELFNGSAETECGRGDSSMWVDAAFERGHRFGVIAADDSHYPVTDTGRAWTMVKASDRSAEAVLSALADGASYASAGPTLHSVVREGEHIYVHCSPARAVIAQLPREDGLAVVAGGQGQRNGAVLEHDTAGLLTRVRIDLRGGEVFARVRVVDAAGRSAWTNLL